MRAPRLARLVALAAAGALIAAAAPIAGRAAPPRFFPDDPLVREPEPRDASGTKPHELVLLYEIAENLFSTPGDRGPAGRARNANTLDEVPDSSWFTNRAGARPLTADEVGRGPDELDGLAPGPWTVISAKTDGITPGFTVRDTAGEVWFVKVDPPGYPDMATGAEIVSTKLLWALGYHVPENHLAELDPATLAIDPKATIHPIGFPPRPLKRSDIGSLLRQADRGADGRYRVMASRRLPGRPLGGFRFYGTRPDDPNDVIPHEDRRELRGYVVASAWLNHVDAKSINSLDVLVSEGSQARVRHYLLDFGSTLGSSAVFPREYFEGHEYMVEPHRIGKKAALLGFPIEPWRTVPLMESPGLGRLPRDPDAFDPEAWRPTVPSAAMLRARPDDKFWMARKVAAITDDQIRAAVAAARYAQASDADFLVKTLIGRRDAIARAYLPAVNPIVGAALDAQGVLSFENAAVAARVADAPAKYTARWSRLDDTDPAGDRAIGTSEGTTTIKAPADLPTDDGVLVQAEVSATGTPHQAWTTPVKLVFRRTQGTWKWIGRS